MIAGRHLSAGGKSGLRKARYWLMARHDFHKDLVTESATENIPPLAIASGKGETVG